MSNASQISKKDRILGGPLANMATPIISLPDRFSGLLLGTAVGDALGLPAEGVSRGRIQRKWHGEWRHRFLFGRGMVSDDTEHTLFVAQGLLVHPNDVDAFRRSLAWKLRLWLLGIPAGIGLATLKAIIRLWLGFPPNRSGVWSAGNGPAMRSAIIGAYFPDDPLQRRAFVSASTRLTHTDPKAETAALAVAEAAAWSVIQDKSIQEWLNQLAGLGNDDEWQQICRKLTAALTANKSVSDFADDLGLQRGVTGYAYHSVPVALYAWLHHADDFRAALVAALDCGGDTDTVGAIVGALMGARTGCGGIPREWIEGVCDRPRSIGLLTKIGNRLASQKAAGSVRGSVAYFWPLLAVRNAVFLIVVLFHGFRRLLPPY
jgi:ADP-ribosylglycohydrolase